MIKGRKRRTLEQVVILRMKLLSNWLTFWEEEVNECADDGVALNVSFGLLQLRDLQKSLSKLEARLQEFEDQN